jgi:metallophosphoesterase superfamily enzyme
VLSTKHPAWKLIDASGVKHRLPVFAAGEKLTLSPAFSLFSRGIDLSKACLSNGKTKSGGRFHMFAAAEERSNWWLKLRPTSCDQGE